MTPQNVMIPMYMDEQTAVMATIWTVYLIVRTSIALY